MKAFVQTDVRFTCFPQGKTNGRFLPCAGRILGRCTAFQEAWGMAIELLESLRVGAFCGIPYCQRNVELPHASHVHFKSPCHPHVIAPLLEGHTRLRQKKSL